MLSVSDLGKTYRVADKQPGLSGTLGHLFRRRYRDIEAVSGVNFSIEAGEFVGFLGANGAGKTTTLKMLSGLIRPSQGSALVMGHEPFAREHAFLKQITLVMGQKQQLIWDLPALDSLRINGAVYELSAREARQRIGELGEMLDANHLLTQPVRKLSLGERMKCELLAALLHRPSILFLDEPTLGLDINAQESIRSFLKRYNQRYGATVLLTSHYMADITALCSRVLVIHQGKLVYDGPLSSLAERLTPDRVIELRLTETVSDEVLRSFGEVRSKDGLRVSLVVERALLRKTIARIFEELKPTDLNVHEPAIETVIGPLLRGEQLAAAREPLEPTGPASDVGPRSDARTV
jgi:ABC-2 type transport system ATP-binding protein